MLSALCRRTPSLLLIVPILLGLEHSGMARASIPAQPSLRQRSFLQQRIQQRRYSRPPLKIHRQFRLQQQRQLDEFLNQRQQQFRQQRQQRQQMQQRDLRRQRILQPPSLEQRPENGPLNELLD